VTEPTGTRAAVANFLALSRQAAHQQCRPSSVSKAAYQSPYALFKIPPSEWPSVL